jgi:hypothetical protein
VFFLVLQVRSLGPHRVVCLWKLHGQVLTPF